MEEEDTLEDTLTLTFKHYQARPPPRTTLSPRKSSPIHDQRKLVPSATIRSSSFNLLSIEDEDDSNALLPSSSRPPNKKNIEKRSPNSHDVLLRRRRRENLALSRLNLWNHCSVWMRSKRSKEYQEIGKEERNAKEHAKKTRCSLKEEKLNFPALEETARRRESKMEIQEWHLKEVEAKVKECQQRLIQAENECVNEAAHLLRPMNASLDSIAGSKQEDDDNDEKTRASVFTMKCLSEMIPLLPPKRAMLEFNPLKEKAEKKAEHVKKEKRQSKHRENNAKGLYIQRPKRTLQEIVLTCLSIITNPDEYKKVAGKRSKGGVDGGDGGGGKKRKEEQEKQEEGGEQHPSIPPPPYSVPTLPYRLVDDEHFEDMPAVLHQLASDLFLTSIEIGTHAHSLHVERQNAAQQLEEAAEVAATPQHHTKHGACGLRTRHHPQTKAGGAARVAAGISTNVTSSEEKQRAAVVAAAAAAVQRELQIAHNRAAARAFSETLIGNHGTFFDPFHVWQVVELDHCLGVPFGGNERDASNRNVFDGEFLQLRDLAIADLNKEMTGSGSIPWSSGRKQRQWKQEIESPHFLLLRLCLSILHLWRGLLSVPDTTEDGVVHNLGRALSERRNIRKEIQEVHVPKVAEEKLKVASAKEAVASVMAEMEEVHLRVVVLLLNCCVCFSFFFFSCFE